MLHFADGDGGQVEGECPSRSESAPLSDQSKSLVLLNYFSSIPILDKACVENADKEIKMLATCRAAAGNRWGNYLAVDFYKVAILRGRPLPNPSMTGMIFQGYQHRL